MTFIIPSAFVGCPMSSFDALPVEARRRIVCAGPFHNLVFWLCILLVGKANFSPFLYSALGYQDVTDVGLVVVDVDVVSPPFV